METFSFNLIDEPWIPCVMSSGDVWKLGLGELFLKAGQIRGFDFMNPLEEASLYRFLLALAHRVVDGPRNTGQWKALYEAKGFDSGQVKSYLDQWHGRFDLFSSQYPFFQTPGLEILDKENHSAPAPVTLIQTGRASGNTKTLFDHTSDKEILPLTPGQSARTLLSAQCYLLGGLNKKKTNRFGYQQSFLHGSMVTGLFCLLEGETLFHTLVLNLLIYNDSDPMPSREDDCPVWERGDVGGTKSKTPRGYLDYLTCKSRHLRLVPEKVDGETRVRWIHIAQGEAFQTAGNPFAILRKNKQGESFPVQLDPSRMLWRDSLGLFSFGVDGDQRPRAFRRAGNIRLQRIISLPDRHRCMVFALANDKANPLAWRRESLTIPTDLLAKKKLVDRLRLGMNIMEKGGLIIDDAGKDFVRGCLPHKTKEVEVRFRAESCGHMAYYWEHMETAFHHLVLAVSQGDGALRTLEEEIKTVVRTAFKTCIQQRFGPSASTYQAWAKASTSLERKLTKGLIKGGDNQ